MESPPGPVSRREQEFSFSLVAITLDVVNNQTKTAALPPSIEQQGWNLTRHGWWLLLQRCSALQWRDWASGRVRRTHCLRQRKAKAASATCSCCLPLASALLCSAFRPRPRLAASVHHLCTARDCIRWMHNKSSANVRCRAQPVFGAPWACLGAQHLPRRPVSHVTSIQK